MTIAAGAPKWVTLTTHRLWLLQQAEALLAFFEKHGVDPRGGFLSLADDGSPLPRDRRPDRQLYATCRMVHCYSIAHLLGRPGADAMIDHGMAFIWNGHRDAANGGYFWGIGDGAPTDDTKQAYGHAFVLLAASSAKVAGHPDADRLLADISAILHARFWDDAHGAVAEQFTARLAGLRRLSRPELQHASHGSADGGLRGDRRRHLSAHGRAHRRPDHSPQRRAKRLAHPRTLRRRVAGRPRLCRQPDIPPVRHHARPLAGMEPTAAATVGTRRAQAGWLPDAAKGCSQARSATAGTRPPAASTTRSTGTARRMSPTAISGRAARASAPPRSSTPSTATRCTRNGIAASGTSPRRT